MSTVLGTSEEDRSTLLALSIFKPSVEPLQQLLDASVQAALELVRADGGKLWLYTGERLLAASIINVDAKCLRQFSPRKGEGLSGICLQREEPLVSDDVLADSRAARPEMARKLNMRGFAAVPVSVGSRAIGVLSIQSSSPRTFTDEEVRLLGHFGKRLGLIIHHCTYFPEMAPEWIANVKYLHNVDLSLPAPALSRKKETVGPAPDRVLPKETPKTIHAPTLRLIYSTLAKHKVLTCAQAATLTGLSLVSARRYMTYLVETGIACKEPGYGQRGRPKYLYCLKKESKGDSHLLQHL